MVIQVFKKKEEPHLIVFIFYRNIPPSPPLGAPPMLGIDTETLLLAKKKLKNSNSNQHLNQPQQQQSIVALNQIKLSPATSSSSASSVNCDQNEKKSMTSIPNAINAANSTAKPLAAKKVTNKVIEYL